MIKIKIKPRPQIDENKTQKQKNFMCGIGYGNIEPPEKLTREKARKICHEPVKKP